ncbi:polymer-forming cytoskeletal protein [Gammaproteobacteria bacterium]|nr:polymer-forming cytoskeletal protein [Gammaproteobacteria bacterium]|tara:strand:- start:3346 stop:3849 length:504 start_codon:yes stop_codon:yes gene_type:complete
MFSKYKKFISGSDDSSLDSDNKAGILEPSLQSAVIGAGVTIEGQVVSHEDVIIAGEVNGAVIAKNHHIHVAKSGVVKADITAKIIAVEGTVTGNLTGLEHVMITATSNVQGNIESPRVTLEDGAKFKGSIEMNPGEPAQSILPIFPVADVKARSSSEGSDQIGAKAS